MEKVYNVGNILTWKETMELKGYYILLYHQGIKGISNGYYPKGFWNMYFEGEFENANSKEQLVSQCENKNNPYMVLKWLKKEKELLFKIVKIY